MNSGTSVFELHELENAVKIAVENLEVGDISEPSYVKMEDGKEAYRVYLLLDKTSAHTANLKDDYKQIRDLALEHKKDETISEWINTSLEKTYVRLNDDFSSLGFQYNWVKK